MDHFKAFKNGVDFFLSCLSIFLLLSLFLNQNNNYNNFIYYFINNAYIILNHNKCNYSSI